MVCDDRDAAVVLLAGVRYGLRISGGGKRFLVGYQGVGIGVGVGGVCVGLGARECKSLARRSSRLVECTLRTSADMQLLFLPFPFFIPPLGLVKGIVRYDETLLCHDGRFERVRLFDYRWRGSGGA
jgi:hypothetical protein